MDKSPQKIDVKNFCALLYLVANRDISETRHFIKNIDF